MNELLQQIKLLEAKMTLCVKNLEFEDAANIRDDLKQLRLRTITQ
jgi:excinuclease UvrABC helicase subunit UvrB